MEVGTSPLTPEVANIILSEVFSVILPIVMFVLMAGLIMAIVKTIVGKMAFSFSRMSGCTVRESRKNKKKAEAVIDLVSAANDLNVLKK